MSQFKDLAEATAGRIEKKRQEQSNYEWDNEKQRKHELDAQENYVNNLRNAMNSAKNNEALMADKRSKVHGAWRMLLGVFVSWLSFGSLFFFACYEDLLEEGILFLQSFDRKFFLYFFFALAILGGCLKVSSKLTEPGDGFGGWLFNWLYFGFIMPIACIIEAAIIAGKSKKTYTEARKELRELQDNKNSYFSELAKSKENAIAKNQAEINRLQLEIAEEKEELAVRLQRFHAAYEAVQTEFGSFLDERDWGNVDLIIFNYETGRALDMRDALMQVDNERRNERLVKAVQDAAKSISASISRGFGALQTSLNTHFTRLDNTIANFSGQLSNVAEKSLQHSQSLGKQLEKIAESSSAQQALLAKANTSSDELAASVERIRMIENDRYYGIH